MGTAPVPRSEPRFAWAVAPLAIALLACAIALRFLWVDSVPGIDGDEAQTANEIVRAAAGLPHSYRSIARQFFNPLMLLTEKIELALAHPSFLLLRLPAPLWASMGLLLNYLFLRWLYRDRMIALLATSFMACMPLHLAHSRIEWDPTYLLFVLNFVLYPLLALAAGRGSRPVWLCLILAIPLCLWTHATTGLAIFTLGLSVAFVRRNDLGTWLAARLRFSNQPGVNRSGLGLAFIAVLLAFAASVLILLLRLTQQRSSHVLRNCIVMAGMLLARPSNAAAYLAHLGDAFSGQSVFDDFIGVPVTPLMRCLSLALLAAALALSLRLLFSSSAADRALAIFWLIVPAGLIAFASVLNIDSRGNERYILWSAPLFSLLLVRGIASLGDFRPRRAALITLPLSGLFLFLFVRYYLIAGRYAEFMDTQDVQWTTAPIEPKAATAHWIMSALSSDAPVRVFTEEWSLQHPIQFLLGLHFNVTRNLNPTPTTPTPFFIVGYTGSSFGALAIRAANASHGDLIFHEIPAGNGTPFIAVWLVKSR